MLLSSSDDFCLAPILARASAQSHAPADMEERIRDILTIWAGQILDYPTAILRTGAVLLPQTIEAF